MKLATLAEALRSKTLDNRLDWSMLGSSQISLIEGRTLIEINEFNPNFGYQLVVRNEQGIVLDSENFGGDSHAAAMFQHIKRKHLRVDEALEDLMRRIQSR